MKRFFFISTLLIWICFACAAPASGQDETPNDYSTWVTGQVTCEGKPLSGAVISDGIEVTTTDDHGRYELRSPGYSGYVFISTPAGYKVVCEGALPKHYVNIRKKKTEGVDFQLLPMPEAYTLFVMADVHLTGSAADKDLKQFRGSFLPDIKAEIARTKGEIVSISLGDMTTDVRWYSNSFYFPQYLREIKDYPGPLYHIMGNHDNDPHAAGTGSALNASAKAPYKRYLGPNYYSVNIGKVHYVMLDNISYGGRYVYQYMVDPVQLEWLRKDLALIDESTPLIVSMHVPAYQYSGIKNGIPQIKKRTSEFQDVSELLSLLEPFHEVHILSGHDHLTRNIQIKKNILEHTLVSASAISWKINDVNNLIISHDGTPSGYQLFHIDGEKIQWQLKSVGQTVEQSQFRAYDLNTVPLEYGGNPGANEILVNVFNWDPQWKISASEDGKELTAEQVYVKDPLYVINRDKTEVFPTRPKDWRGAHAVHMFLLKAGSSSSEIEIRVTDRFGTTYTQQMIRPKKFDENTLN